MVDPPSAGTFSPQRGMGSPRTEFVSARSRYRITPYSQAGRTLGLRPRPAWTSVGDRPWPQLRDESRSSEVRRTGPGVSSKLPVSLSRSTHPRTAGRSSRYRRPGLTRHSVQRWSPSQGHVATSRTDSPPGPSPTRDRRRASSGATPPQIAESSCRSFCTS